MVVMNSTALVFVAPGALRMYRERYPEVPGERWHLITNGYDEVSFIAAQQRATQSHLHGRPLVVVHSGLLYPQVGDRNPVTFFDALVNLRIAGKIDPSSLKIVLRASGHDDIYRALLRERALEDLVSLEPPLSYIDALAEMIGADGLLLVQGAISNPNIPAKLYEYLRARRPIFALTDEKGDTAAVLRDAKVGTIASLDSSRSIERAFEQFIQQVRSGTAPIAPDEIVRAYSRESKVRDMAMLFEHLVKEGHSHAGA
jgi:hypothetical protein